jgi:hypothetical protein
VWNLSRNEEIIVWIRIVEQGNRCNDRELNAPSHRLQPSPDEQTFTGFGGIRIFRTQAEDLHASIDLRKGASGMAKQSDLGGIAIVVSRSLQSTHHLLLVGSTHMMASTPGE